MTDIGATLREARMRARIDIIEVERATKIRTKYLRAMEDEEWGLLPGPTFVKSFLRTYADYLGLDSRLLVEEWKRAYESPAEGEPAPRPTRPSRSSGRSGGRPPTPRLPEPPGRWRPFVLVGVVLVVLLAGLYVLGQVGGNDDNGTTTAPKGPRAGAKKKAPKHKKAKAKPPAPTNVKLRVVPTGTVYVCLTDGNGKVLIPGETLAAGAAPRTFTAKKFLVNLGNAGVQLTANGKQVPITASASAIGMTITAKGQQPLPEGKRPTCT